MAAHIEGLYAAGLDQTGLAQKGGPVVSDVRISAEPIDTAVKAGARSVDLMLGLDVLGVTSDETLATADPDRTVAVINLAEVATSAMVQDPSIIFIKDSARIDRATRASENLYLDAQWISERLFGDHLPTNMVMIGAAYQHGCLPMSDASIEEAIHLNGAGVDHNLTAFAWGRAAVIDQAAVIAALSPTEVPGPSLPSNLRQWLTSMPVVVVNTVEVRAADLVQYQSTAYAKRYIGEVNNVIRIETEQTGDPALPVSAAYARSLHKLMAYKDEYEVARLHLDAAQRSAIDSEFGELASTKVLLHPPALKSLGLKHKIGLGAAARPTFRALRASKHLRGTVFDPFGRSEMRRMERALIDEYKELMTTALAKLNPTTAGLVSDLAALPEEIRGYEDVKRRNVERFRADTKVLIAQLNRMEFPEVDLHRSAAG
jgi:indolepyruvate ferredoxin oxidoreductase